MVVENQYYRRNGMRPDLDQPKDLSEKICWLKLYGMTPLHRDCADKVAVRDYVRTHAGGSLLTREILVTHRPQDVTPANIPDERFVLKTNHDAGSVIICKDRNSFDWAAAQRKIDASLKRNFARVYKERQYTSIQRRILVEEFIDPGPNKDLHDYKIFCFHGVPHLIQVDIERSTLHQQLFYDTEWRRLQVRRHFAAAVQDLSCPTLLDDMLEVASALAAPFQFCRIDLYEAQNRLWFGEISFTLGLGHHTAGLFGIANAGRLIKLAPDPDAAAADAGRGLICRPVNGAGGRDVRLIQDLAEIPTCGTYLLERKIVQHDYAARIFPGSVNTMRILTMADPVTGVPFIAAAAHRFGVAGSAPVDNFKKGGISSLIDLESGRLSVGRSNPGWHGQDRHPCHPETAAPIENVQVPCWPEAKQLALALAAAIPGLAYAGWDICISGDGPRVIEGNSRIANPNLIQAHRPLLLDKRVRDFFRHHKVLSEERYSKLQAA